MLRSRRRGARRVASQRMRRRREGKPCNAERFARSFSPAHPCPAPPSALSPSSAALVVRWPAILPHPNLPSFSPPSPSPPAPYPGTSPPPFQQSSCSGRRIGGASGTWWQPPQRPPSPASTLPPPTLNFTSWLSPAQGWSQAQSWRLTMRRSLRRWTARGRRSL